jgi:hypothetical protein
MLNLSNNEEIIAKEDKSEDKVIFKLFNLLASL